MVTMLVTMESETKEENEETSTVAEATNSMGRMNSTRRKESNGVEDSKILTMGTTSITTTVGTHTTIRMAIKPKTKLSEIPKDHITTKCSLKT
jgi:hypothetical protein